MADPTAIPPTLIEKALDPNNLVAVVTIGALWLAYKWGSRRFDLEVEEQRDIIKRIDELERRIDKLEAKIEVLHEH
jgi:hypothetical protein